MVNKLYKFVRSIIKRNFLLWQSFGFHLTPVSFYQPIPDTRKLSDEVLEKVSRLDGINMNEESQLERLSRFHSEYQIEYEKFPRDKPLFPYQYYVYNGSFESVDGEILWCMVRDSKPNRIMEIGSGNSTYLLAQAILENNTEDPNYDCELVTIDPYPNDTIRAGFPGLSLVVQRGVQDVPLAEFKELVENDILFIDSSHVLKIGSDVYYEYLEILPALNKGVIVHIHDIFFPLEYPKEWMLKYFMFWNEQYLLQAFLSFNDTFEVLWSAGFMHVRHPDKLEEAFSSYKRNERQRGSFWEGSAGSFWMRKVK